MTTKAVIAKTNLLGLLRLSTPQTKKGQSNFSSTSTVRASTNHNQEKQPMKSGARKMVKEDIDWVPHPRTGIYVPKGHEWVMDDVPDNAASFSTTYWLRNVDGVDKDHYYTSVDNF